MSVLPLRIYNGGDDVSPMVQPSPAPPPAVQPLQKKRKRKNPLLRTVFEKLVRPKLESKQRAKCTIRNIELAVELWEDYWQKHTCIQDTRVLRVRGIQLEQLEKFQRWLATEAISERGEKFSASSVNQRMGSIRQILRAAERHKMLKHGRPQIESLPVKAAPKWYFKPAHFDAMWEACDGCTWPRDLPTLDTATWWRALITLYWLYGFRTQELYAYEKDHTPLYWSAITFDAETPSPHGEAMNEHGWMTYVPEKQSWAKPEPLFIPLTRHARIVIDLLAKATRELHGGKLPRDAKLFPWSSAHKSFYRQWELLQERANVRTKAGTPFEVKAYRKTAATYLEEHHKGLAAAVIGWADREDSRVMAKHYVVTENVLVNKLNSYPVPKSFNQWLDPQGPQLRLF